jgi:hypothetical protein
MMKKDITIYLIVNTIIIVSLGCSVSASTTQEPKENAPTLRPTTPFLPTDIRPTTVIPTSDNELGDELTEPIETISTDNIESPLNLGLWRFEASSEVNNGTRLYTAYIWLSPKDEIITLKYSQADSYWAQDFGLCDPYGYHPENPILITEQGNTYETGLMGCYLMVLGSGKSEFMLYPGVPVRGMMDDGPMEFYYMFRIPFQETPKELVFPPLNMVLPLPNADTTIYKADIPDPDRSELVGFKNPVNVVDTLDISVQDIQIRELADDMYLAITHIRINNLNPNLSFNFDLDSKLIDDNGYYLEPYMLFSPHEDLVDDSLCRNNGRRFNSVDIEVPAGGETIAVQCFIMDRHIRILNSDGLMPFPKQMVFIMTLQEITLAFTGEPILP